MKRLFHSRAAKTDKPAGSLVYVGKKRTVPTRISVINYNHELTTVQDVATVEDALKFFNAESMTWIDVEGLAQVEIIESIGRFFDIHPLVLEDIVNTNQRPKFESYETYLYVVLKMLVPQVKEAVEAEQLSIVFGKNYLITFQEGIKGDCFAAVRDNLKKARGRLRKSGCDHLAYALIDSAVDHYFVALEGLGERFEELEDMVMQDPSQKALKMIYRLKRESMFIRRCIWPVRDIVSALEREDEDLVSVASRPYFRDLYDHSIETLEIAEMLRDMTASLMDIYLSSIANKNNAVMKVLTVVSTIFMPLTFLAGVYGMNFKYMPELEWHYGYPIALLGMLAIAAWMWLFFKRKGWA